MNFKQKIIVLLFICLTISLSNAWFMLVYCNETNNKIEFLEAKMNQQQTELNTSNKKVEEMRLIFEGLGVDFQ